MDQGPDGGADPCYVVDEKRLRENLTILRQVAQEAGCKILLAQKAFSMFAVYPLIGEYLAGTTASGLFEAKLGKEEMGGETHIFSAAYVEEEFEEILQVCDHISFNSFAQWKKYRERALKAGKSCSIRINPDTPPRSMAYDPCAAGSRWRHPEELQRKSWRVSKDFISTPCASKTAMRWWRRCRRWKRNSAPSSIR